MRTSCKSTTSSSKLPLWSPALAGCLRATPQDPSQARPVIWTFLTSSITTQYTAHSGRPDGIPLLQTTMRLSILLCTAALVNTALAAALVDVAVPTSVSKRALDGILDGFNNKDQTAAHDLTDTLSTTALVPTQTLDDSGLMSFLGYSSTPTDSTTTKTKANKDKDTTSLVLTGTAYSVIGTPPPIQSTSALSFSAATPPSSTMPTGQAAAASQASSGTSEWKIIGVAVIAFTTVAGILLLSVFFDQWWRFVRDIFGRKRKETEEELVPDWEKAEWDLRFGQDRQRYPSFSSLPSMARVQPPPPAALGPSRNFERNRTIGPSPSGTFDEASRSQASPRQCSPKGVGLGLGRMGSVRREERSASSKSPKEKAGQEIIGKNPFDDDARSMMPDDVYGGVEN
ncbi:hypothetical protein ONZ51_g12259 [Trametes cubensis]|uniref:Uncharacterized protein n=1 Tax=Trametes cubensis TaxID=1111947 RepID=A0AAD7TGW9_9APHY|nr:hypothetical protein ONZ51_g12259 [Trametes cubensis]